MNKKQSFLTALYLLYCTINQCAMAAVLVDDHRSAVNLESFALGLIGAITVSAWLQKIDKSPKTYGSLGFTMLFAGLGSHAIIQIILSLDWVKNCGCLDYAALYYPVPLVIGVIVPTLVPVAIDYAKGWLGGKRDTNA